MVITGSGVSSASEQLKKTNINTAIIFIILNLVVVAGLQLIQIYK